MRVQSVMVPWITCMNCRYIISLDTRAPAHISMHHACSRRVVIVNDEMPICLFLYRISLVLTRFTCSQQQLSNFWFLLWAGKSFVTITVLKLSTEPGEDGPDDDQLPEGLRCVVTWLIGCLPAIVRRYTSVRRERKTGATFEESNADVSSNRSPCCWANVRARDVETWRRCFKSDLLPTRAQTQLLSAEACTSANHSAACSKLAALVMS